MEFQRTSNGVRLVGDWPYDLLITHDLIESAQPELVQRNGDCITFTVINGSATYRIVQEVEIGFQCRLFTTARRGER